jgi:outer membrane protein insertion porin family
MRRLPLLMFALMLPAQALAGRVDSIEVEAGGRIDPGMVRNIISIKPGDDVDGKILSQNVAALYATGFFKDVSMKEDGGVLRIRVSEQAVVSAVAFEGLSAVKEDDLKKEVRTREHSLFSPAAVRSDVETVKTMYRRMGFFKSVVDAKVIERSDNRYDVVFEVREGSKGYIRNIDVRGAAHFSEGRLLDVIMSKEYSWWKIMEVFDTYDEDRLFEDVRLLYEFYYDGGFLDFEVSSFNARMDMGEENFYLEFVLNEGNRYKVGDISVRSEIPDLETDGLLSEILLEKGRWYSEDLVKKSVAKLSDRLGADGFAFVSVDVAREPDAEAGSVDVAFVVRNSRRALVNKIGIRNNTRTYESVIRRNLSFDEQSAYNKGRFDSSRQKLMALGYFNDVGIAAQPVPGTPDKVDVIVSVDERSTGELSLGAGWSSINKGFLEFGIKENNFMGKGQVLSFNSTYSARENRFGLSFTEPYLFDRDLSGGADLYYTQYRYESTYGYDRDVLGLGLRLGWSYNDQLSHRLRVSARNERLTNIADSLAGYVEGADDYNVYRVGHTLTYSDQVVDYVNDTRRGFVVSGSNDYAGFGGDKTFVKSDLSFKQYFSFWDDEWMFGILAETGKIKALGGTVLNSSERYILGGDTLRGFDYGGVGARHALYRAYTYGGNWIADGTFQLNFPIGIPKKYRVSGYVFYDWGTLGRPDLRSMSGVLYSNKVRTSAGYGIAWNSPIGEISLSWATAIDYEEYDELQRFRFSIGSSF